MAASVLDVAIVGAGVSGVWCGWRLTDPSLGSKRLQDVAIYEMSDRIGGRLLSVAFPGQPEVQCELGGMRFMSTQQLVPWIVRKLQLKTVPAPVAQPENIAYLRGKRMRLGAIDKNPAAVPYNLTPEEKTRAGSLLADAILAIAPGTSGKTGDQLRKAVQQATYMGRPIWQQGFWNDVATQMSGEAFRYTQALGGYDTTQLNWNCADTIVLNADFTKTVKFFRVKEGYEQVPAKLAGLFEQQLGKVHTQRRVLSVVPADLPGGGTGVELTIRDERTGTTDIVPARAVILALPRRSLELLDPSGPILGDGTFRALMQTVTPIPLFKAFVAYDHPWWLDAGVKDGRSVTDLPLRQVYYWNTSAKSEESTLLATYDDTDDVGFWAGLAVDPRPYDATCTDDGDDDRWKTYAAPKAMVDEIHRQLLIMHGVSDEPPEPCAAMFHDWGTDPYGGGVNFWNIGEKSWEVMKAIEKPVAGQPVFVVGEAYSDTQGWVEGALRSAENVLTEQFGLPPVDTGA